MVETNHPNFFEAGAVGFVQLLVEHAEVCRFLFEGVVRRRGHERERLRLPIHAESGPQLLLDADLGQHVSRLGERPVRVRHERRGDWAGLAEKDGTMTNSARWLQWKNVAVPPPGECRLDQDIIAQIFLKVKELYQKDGGKFPDPILNLTWGYTNAQHPALGELLKELNGKALADLTDPKTQVTIKKGQQLPGFSWLKDDGTTSCGNWIYCGSRSGGMKGRKVGWGTMCPTLRRTRTPKTTWGRSS